MRELERITARRDELDALAEELAKKLQEVVRAEREELAVAERVLHQLAEQDRAEAAVAAAPAPARVAGRAVLLIPHRGENPDEAALPTDYRKILAIVRAADGPVQVRWALLGRLQLPRRLAGRADVAEHECGDCGQDRDQSGTDEAGDVHADGERLTPRLQQLFRHTVGQVLRRSGRPGQGVLGLLRRDALGQGVVDLAAAESGPRLLSTATQTEMPSSVLVSAIDAGDDLSWPMPPYCSSAAPLVPKAFPRSAEVSTTS